MKQNIWPAIRLTLACMVFFMGINTLLILAGAQLAPGGGKGQTVTTNEKIVGYSLIGQKFTEDKYFWGRPSAVDYNAAGSGGSNKGPSNPDYLKTVQERIDTFLAHNPGIRKEAVPSDLVTASGAGLDPHISVQGAYVQAGRVAKTRNISTAQVIALVKRHVEKPYAGLFGTEKVNVLRLNIELNKIKQQLE